jgi:hypothetical protein
VNKRNKRALFKKKKKKKNLIISLISKSVINPLLSQDQEGILEEQRIWVIYVIPNVEEKSILVVSCQVLSYFNYIVFVNERLIN